MGGGVFFNKTLPCTSLHFTILISPVMFVHKARGVLVFFLTVLLVVNLGGLSVCIGEIGFTVPLLCRSVFGRGLLAGRLAVSSNASCAMVSGARGREGKRRPAGSLAHTKTGHTTAG